MIAPPRRSELLFLGALAMLLCVALAGADDVGPPRRALLARAFAGHFSYAGGEPQRRRWEDAIERSTSRMSVLTRGVARAYLRYRLAIPAGVTIAFTDGAISIAFSDGSSHTAPADGTPIEQPTGRGRLATVSHELDGGRLRQRVLTRDGGSERVFELGRGRRRLDVHVTVTSKHMTEPITYELTFRRDAADGNGGAPAP